MAKIGKRQAVYNHNKLAVYGIVKGSIDPHFKDKLRSKSEYEAKQDDLVWLLFTIKALCNFDEEEKEPTLDAVESQIPFLTYKQKEHQDLLKDKQLFKQRFDSLKERNMSLGDVKSLTDNLTGTKLKKSEAAVEKFAAMLAIRNSSKICSQLKIDLHNSLAQGRLYAYPTTIEDAFDLRFRYKVSSKPDTTSNNSRRKKYRHNDRRSNDIDDHNNNTRNHNSHQLSFAQADNKSFENATSMPTSDVQATHMQRARYVPFVYIYNACIIYNK